MCTKMKWQKGKCQSEKNANGREWAMERTTERDTEKGRGRKITFQQCPQNQKRKKTFHPINHLPSLRYHQQIHEQHGTAIFALAFGFRHPQTLAPFLQFGLMYLLAFLMQSRFFFSQRSGKITLLMFFVVLFSLSSIAFDFPTEFSALFDSCGVIINLNNEIPKWNPIYNSSEHDVQTNREAAVYLLLCNFIWAIVSVCARPFRSFTRQISTRPISFWGFRNDTRKFVHRLILCYQKLSLWKYAENYFPFGLELFAQTKTTRPWARSVCAHANTRSFRNFGRWHFTV